jgi:glycerate 2-kinase
MEAELRKKALRVFRAALKAADPIEAVLRHVRLEGTRLIVGRRRYALAAFENVYVVGAGKASATMAQAIERVLGRRIRGGLVNVKDGHLAKLKRIELVECSHPVPDARGVEGARRIAEIAQQAGPRDLLLCLISGGASALTPAPTEPVTLDEKQAVTRLLLASGASIHEMNAVRKHLSKFKGGQLARLAYPATVVSLLLSDVIGDDLDVIGSGPTVPDRSTFADAREILVRYGIWDAAPGSVRARIEGGVKGEISETPKPGEKVFSHTENVVIGSNRLAVDAAAQEARRQGLKTMVLSTFVEGETRDVAHVHAAIAKEIRASGRPVRAPACVVSGGETTVKLTGTGLGGRNQEFVLAAAMDLAGMDGVVVLSGGTDGTDGPTDAAGAIADGRTVERARRLGMNAAQFLVNNDSYHFFEPLDGLLKTGPTGTNVMDVRLVLVDRAE